MTKEKHYHLYKRINLAKRPEIKDGRVVSQKKYVVFRCLKPNCTHYVIPDMLEGKIAECSRCHNPFICDKSSKLLREPHCNECTQKKKDIMGSTLDFIKELENDNS